MLNHSALSGIQGVDLKDSTHLVKTAKAGEYIVASSNVRDLADADETNERGKEWLRAKETEMHSLVLYL